MANTLDKLAVGIKGHLDRIDKNAAEWAEEALGLCVKLAEAKTKFPDLLGFGKWFDTSGFALNPHDRAAAIAMGQDPVRARDVLVATKRRSLQHVYEREFRFAHVSKTAPVKPKRPNPKRQQAFDAYDKLKAAGETPTYDTVAAEAGGISTTAVRVVFAVREAEAEREAAEAAVAADGNFGLDVDTRIAAYSAALPPNLRKKFDASIGAYKRELTRGFDEACRREYQKWKDESGITFWLKRLDELERMLTWPRNSVMLKAEYNTILRCLHPDTGAHRTAAERAEAFRLFTHYKLKMIDDEEERENARRELRSNMPKTLAEMIARKTKKTA